MLQEAERYYIKACHELRLLAAPLPFKVSQSCCGERSLGQDSKLDDVSIQHNPLQLPAIPLSPTRLSPLSSPKGHSLLSDDKLCQQTREFRPYETGGKTHNYQSAPKGLLPLRLAQKTNLTTKICLEKREDPNENEEAGIKSNMEQKSPNKQNIMSLEYDIRKYINDVRVEQSQLTTRGTSNGWASINRSFPPTPPSSSSTNSSNPSPIRSQSMEDRIQKGRLREWKRERFCNRKYREMGNEVLAELEEKEKLIASIRDRNNNRLSLNSFSAKTVNTMSPIHE